MTPFRSCYLLRKSRQGTIALIVTLVFPLLLAAAGAGIEFAQMFDARSALQSALDNAALSGASAYVLLAEGDAFRSVAVTTATSSFCEAAPDLPAGLTLADLSGGAACQGRPGPAVSATIGGVVTGSGIDPTSACSSTQSVVPGETCGFLVTVKATATIKSFFGAFLGGPQSITLTATAINPFINLGRAIAANVSAFAWNANSLWIYPLLLDANGHPDFTTNPGAIPDASACTGSPDQTACGVYTMLASTKYQGCTDSNPCVVNGTTFAGSGGVVQNPSVTSAVITATTPLGFAFESTAGGSVSFGDNQNSAPADGCAWPMTVVYNVVTQVYDANNNPLILDSNGGWSLTTHWYYSSYLANGQSPSYPEIALQTNTNINPVTGLAFNIQDVPPIPTVVNGVNSPSQCPNASDPSNRERFVSTYPVTGQSNCSLYIVKDTTSLTPDPSFKVSPGQAPNCFDPTNTPGQQYATMSCQNFAGHSFAFYWNDMGGTNDDSDYYNGTLIVSCAGASTVRLIN